MAIYRVDSNAPGVTEDGTDWDTAYLTLDGLLTTETFSLGDVIWLEDGHAEGASASIIYTFTGGTRTQPIQVVSVDKTDDSYSPGALLDIPGGIIYDISIRGFVAFYGVTFEAPDNIYCCNGAFEVVRFVECTINPGDRFGFASENYQGKTIILENCDITCADTITSVGIDLYRVRNRFIMRGGSVSAPNASSGSYIVNINALSNATNHSEVLFEDVDFSNWGSGAALILNSNSKGLSYTFRRCKLPSGYIAGTLADTDILEIEGCEDGTSTVSFLGITEHTSEYGTVKAATQHRNGGASDGDNDYSWEAAAASDITLDAPLWLPPLMYWAEPGSQTVTLYTANDTDLKDTEIGFVLEHPDESATNAEPHHTVISTRPSPVSSGSNATRDSGSTWDGAGTGTDGSTGQQKIVSDSFNPTVAGYVIVRPYLAKASETAYFCPKLDVTGLDGDVRTVHGVTVIEAGGTSGGGVCGLISVGGGLIG